MPISFTTAALGGEVCVPLIDNSKIQLKIPAGTETGNKLRLKAKGMSKVKSSSRGDLYVHVYIVIPKTLNKKQREMLIELDKDLRILNAQYKDESFFSRIKKNIWS